MNRSFVRAGLPIVLLGLWAAIPGGLFDRQSTAAAQSSTERQAYRFEELTDGVYVAIGTGAMTVMSNALVMINDDHVMLVDTSVTTAAARALVAGIGTLTDKLIKYVFNTHYHFDHAHGNQIFGDAAEIIGHEFVRERLLGNVLEQRTSVSFSNGIPAQVDALRNELTEAADVVERSELRERLRILEAHWSALQEVEPTPPNITYRDQMVIHKGGREVQLHFLGRGHTGGDTMVFLPEERIVSTGDFLLGRPEGGLLAYMGDAYIDEWPDSLERLEALDFDVVVPGHGTPFRDRGQTENFQRYLRDLWSRVSQMRSDGLSVQQASERVDMSDHEPQYGPRARNVDQRAIVRLYELLQYKMAI